MPQGPNVIFSKSPPNFFVLSKFPNSSAGPLVSMVPEPELALADNPKLWYGLPYGKILSIRGGVLWGRESVNLRNAAGSSRFAELRASQLATSPFDMELTFRSLSRAMRYSEYHNPLGGAGRLEKFQICENPKISGKAEKIVGDDLKASEMMASLHDGGRGFDNYYISKLLTSGLLGKKKRLVPTMWGITATDSMLSSQLMGEIKGMKELDAIYAGTSEFLHNRFLALFLPGKFEFENFEAWAASTAWAKEVPSSKFRVLGPETQHSKPETLLGAKDYNMTEEYEGFSGRTDYAEKQVGAYYAVRLAVCEKLKALGRQARVVVMREISPQYNVPVGVWQVRENVRHALLNLRKFDSFGELARFISSYMKVPFPRYFRESRILPQKRLGDFWQFVQ